MIVDQQQVEKPTHQLPKHEERKAVRARDHAQEYKGDQAQQDIKSGIPTFSLEIPDGIEMNERPYSGDQDHHDNTQPIAIKAETKPGRLTRPEAR